jgi:predicted nuclease of predicted toxin-antitoxin system
MKVLIDECAPRALLRFLTERGHQFRTVQEVGWSGKQNGELLKLAEQDFDVLVTLDVNLQYQQNLKQRKISIVVIRSASNRLIDLLPLFVVCARALQSIRPGEFVEIGIDSTHS